MQDTCVGLEPPRDHGRDHSGVKRREAVTDPRSFLNRDALVHTRDSHESIIHGVAPAPAARADPGVIQALPMWDKSSRCPNER